MEGGSPSMPLGVAPEPNHFSPGLGRVGWSGSNCATAWANVGGATMPPAGVFFASSASW